MPAQQINSKNLTQQQGFDVSQHFTLCGTLHFVAVILTSEP